MLAPSPLAGKVMGTTCPRPVRQPLAPSVSSRFPISLSDTQALRPLKVQSPLASDDLSQLGAPVESPASGNAIPGVNELRGHTIQVGLQRGKPDSTAIVQ